MGLNNTWMPYFFFNGHYSHEYGVIVEKLPDITKPEKKVDKFNIPGRSGTFYIDNNTYKNTSKTVDCAVKSLKYIDHIDEWLEGNGWAVFSNEKDRKYQAMVCNQMNFSKVIRQWRRFSVVFDCQPYKYNVNDSFDRLELIKGAEFYGKGNDLAAPLVEIYGNGNVELTINGNTLSIQNIEGYMAIDAELSIAYKANGVNATCLTGGNILKLLPKNQPNTVSWSGNVSKVIIEPRWRWI